MVTPQHFLIIGDAFLAEERRKAILAQIQEHAAGEISQSTLDLSETKLDTVLTEARTLPFLAAAQIFVLKNADLLKDKHLEAFAQYLQNPAEGAYFIFETAEMEKSSPLVKLIKDHGETVFLDDKQRKSASGRFIQNKLKSFGKTITPDALARLEDQVGAMPVFLDSILEQLIHYAGEKKEINAEMVELFEENWQEVDVFSLVNAIGSKKTSQALVLLKQLAADKDQDVIGLLGLLHWQIRRLWQAKALLETGQPESVISRKCKISPRQAPYFMRQLRSFSLKKLEDALEGLFQMDWKIKTGRTEGPLALETWVVELTS